MLLNPETIKYVVKILVNELHQANKTRFYFPSKQTVS